MTDDQIASLLPGPRYLVMTRWYLVIRYSTIRYVGRRQYGSSSQGSSFSIRLFAACVYMTPGTTIITAASQCPQQQQQQQPAASSSGTVEEVYYRYTCALTSRPVTSIVMDWMHSYQKQTCYPVLYLVPARIELGAFSNGTIRIIYIYDNIPFLYPF